MAYLELQVKSRKDYAVIKKYSDYFSDRTFVCSLNPDGIKELLKEEDKEILLKHMTEKDKEKIKKGLPSPLADIDNGNIVIHNGSSIILAFLDVRSKYKPELKIVNMWKLFELMDAGLIKGSERFWNIMKPLKPTDSAKLLFASTGKMRFRGKLWSMNDLPDETTIADLGFDTAKPIKKKLTTISDLVVEDFYPDSITLTLSRKNSPKLYKAKFYYVNSMLGSLIKKGSKVTLVAEGIKDFNNESHISNPMIVPNGLNLDKLTLLKTPYSIPSGIYNAAHSEYKFRMKRGRI